MIIYPAIDIKDGQVVRLAKGDLDQATVYDADPASQACTWETSGFSWIHVVDLDGAVAGEPRNAGAVRSILDAVKTPVQLGGGVRTLSQVGYWLEEGVTRVVLGTAAVRDPELVRNAAQEFPERIAVAIDVRQGRVAVDGWLDQTDVDALDLAVAMADAGVAALIVTDVDRDGLQGGVNVDLTGSIADAVPIPVIASGGVGSIADVGALRARAGRPIAGVIVGRALYEGGVDAKTLLASPEAAA